MIRLTTQEKRLDADTAYSQRAATTTSIAEMQELLSVYTIQVASNPNANEAVLEACFALGGSLREALALCETVIDNPVLPLLWMEDPKALDGFDLMYIQEYAIRSFLWQVYVDQVRGLGAQTVPAPMPAFSVKIRRRALASIEGSWIESYAKKLPRGRCRSPIDFLMRLWQRMDKDIAATGLGVDRETMLCRRRRAIRQWFVLADDVLTAWRKVPVVIDYPPLPPGLISMVRHFADPRHVFPVSR